MLIAKRKKLLWWKNSLIFHSVVFVLTSNTIFYKKQEQFISKSLFYLISWFSGRPAKSRFVLFLGRTPSFLVKPTHILQLNGKSQGQSFLHGGTRRDWTLSFGRVAAFIVAERHGWRQKSPNDENGPTGSEWAQSHNFVPLFDFHLDKGLLSAHLYVDINRRSRYLRRFGLIKKIVDRKRLKSTFHTCHCRGRSGAGFRYF